MYTNFHIRRLGDNVLAPFAKFFHVRLGLSPNNLSMVSLFFGLASVFALFLGFITPAFVLLALSLFFDGLDGVAARMFSLESRRGELLELVFDRVQEFLLFFALAYQDFISLKLAILSFFAIVLVSVIRDKSGFDPGLKRIVLLFGYFFGNFEIAMAIIFLANLSGFMVSALIVDIKEQASFDSLGTG